MAGGICASWARARRWKKFLRRARRAKEWIFVGCGSSFYLAEAAANSWNLLTGQRARAVPASEILLFPGLLQANGRDTQAVVISRSGQTSETIRAAKVLSRDLRVPTLGITCAAGSELEQRLRYFDCAAGRR